MAISNPIVIKKVDKNYTGTPFLPKGDALLNLTAAGVIKPKIIEAPKNVPSPVASPKAWEAIKPMQPAPAKQLLSVDDFAAKIKAKYPQYENIDNSELTEKVISKHPEYKDAVDKQSRVDAVYAKTYTAPTPGVLETIGAGLAGIPQGVANVGQNISEGMTKGINSLLLSQIKPEDQQAARNFYGMKTPEQRAAVNTNQEQALMGGAKALNPTAFEVGRAGGKLAATSALIPGVGPLKNVGVIGRMGIKGLEGAAQTQAASYLGEGKAASLEDTAIGALIGGGIEGVASLKNPLYNQAFRGTKKSLMEKGINLEGKMPGEIIADSGLKGVKLSTLLKNNKSSLQNTRDELGVAASKADGIVGSSVKPAIKADMHKMLGLGDLPQEAQATKDAYAMVNRIVDDYIPDGAMNGKEVVATIKSLNSTLSDKLLGMGISNPTTSKGITQALEKATKVMLDDMASKGGAEANLVKSLYKKYSQSKLVEAILKDKELQKTMMRQIIFGTAGASGLGGYDISQGNYTTGAGKALLGFLGGMAGAKLSSSTTAPIVLGKALGSTRKISKAAITANALRRNASKSKNEK